MAENVIKQDLVDVQEENNLEYGMSLLYDRSLADIRDGCKPVHRRILHSMSELGLKSNKPHKKSARVVGEAMGKYHPHGDASIYGAAVRMAQGFSMNIPTIDGQGNFGSQSGDSAAAARYTEMRLSKFGESLLEDINRNAVDLVPNYDGTLTEPEVLPAKTVNLLINGSLGIAVGFAQNIPTHNPLEVCQTVIDIIKNPQLTVEQVAEKVYPDFPTGGILCSMNEVKKAYIEKNGSVGLCAKMEFNEKKREFVVTEIPYGTTISDKQSLTSKSQGVVNSIASAVKDKKVEGITSIKDHSDKHGINIIIGLKKDYDPEVVKNQLYKYTKLKTTVKINLVCKNGEKFDTYNIKEIFTEWINFRRLTIKRILINDINKINYQIHINDGLMIANKNIDEVISIIKKGKSTEEIKTKLMKKFELSEPQATAITDMRLIKISNLEVGKLEAQQKELKQKSLDILNTLSNPENLDNIIIEEQKELMKQFKNCKRKTELAEMNTDISIEDIIPNEETLVLITEGNLIKRIPIDINTQKRGGKGISHGKNEVNEAFQANTKDHLLCFTNTGRVFDIKVYEIAEGSKNTKGRKIESYLNLKTNEEVCRILCLTDTQFKDRDSSIAFITAKGQIKRTKLELFNSSFIKNTGIIAMMMKPNDVLVNAKYIDSAKDMQDIIVITKNGMAIRYDHKEIPESKRDTMGCTAINLIDNDEVIDMEIIESDDQEVFFATKNGLGKIVKVKDVVKKPDPTAKKNGIEKLVDIDDGFPRQKRSASSKGRIGIKLNEGDSVADIEIINTNDTILLIASNKMISFETEAIKPIKRPTLGVKLIDLDEGQTINKIIKR